MNRKEKFLECAKYYADLSTFYRHKLGACIVKQGKKLAFGFNNHKSHPMQMKYNQERTDMTMDDNPPHYLHAEMDALKKLKNIDLKGAEIYVYRTKVDGSPGLARPCAACMKAIKEKGIKKVIYSTDYGYAEEFLIDITVMPKGRRPI